MKRRREGLVLSHTAGQRWVGNITCVSRVVLHSLDLITD